MSPGGRSPSRPGLRAVCVADRFLDRLQKGQAHGQGRHNRCRKSGVCRNYADVSEIRRYYLRIPTHTSLGPGSAAVKTSPLVLRSRNPIAFISPSCYLTPNSRMFLCSVIGLAPFLILGRYCTRFGRYPMVMLLSSRYGLTMNAEEPSLGRAR